MDAYKKIFEEKDSMDNNIEFKLLSLSNSFNILNKLITEIDKPLEYLKNLKEQINLKIITNEEKYSELYIYKYLISSIKQIRELWVLLMKMTFEYLKLQIKNNQFAYYFEVQQKLYCIHRYILSINILPEKNMETNNCNKN